MGTAPKGENIWEGWWFGSRMAVGASGSVRVSVDCVGKRGITTTVLKGVPAHTVYLGWITSTDCTYGLASGEERRLAAASERNHCTAHEPTNPTHIADRLPPLPPPIHPIPIRFDTNRRSEVGPKPIPQSQPSCHGLLGDQPKKRRKERKKRKREERKETEAGGRRRRVSEAGQHDPPKLLAQLLLLIIMLLRIPQAEVT